MGDAMTTAATTSANRVPSHTAPNVNERIRNKAIDSIRHYAQNPAGIGERLRELDREWDVERALETGSSVLSLTGLAIGYLITPWGYLLTLVVQGFFLQHALQGWCPPLPVFRRKGFRTRDEIDRERFALKAIRGDFDGISGAGAMTAPRAYEAAERN
ncbi:hypothetical protein PHYC_03367 [Phycisphaerales bacterium]|nr:hypothetical protein PHYC_03367 [Phycisphaerales bacterium]